MVCNRRTDARFHRISKGQAVDRESVHGARLVPNQKEDWIVVRDAYPPLISRRLFEQAIILKFYYVYILHSIADAGRYYVGMTSDLETRLKMHNAGKCTHTAKYRPWQIETAIAFRCKDKVVLGTFMQRIGQFEFLN